MAFLSSTLTYYTNNIMIITIIFIAIIALVIIANSTPETISQSNKISSSRLLDLPQELLDEIVSYVEWEDVASLKSCSRECDRRIDKTLASKSIYLRNFGPPPPSSTSLDGDSVDWVHELGRRVNLLTQLRRLLVLEKGRIDDDWWQLEALRDEIIDYDLLLDVRRDARDVARYELSSVLDQLLPMLRAKYRYPNPRRTIGIPGYYTLPMIRNLRTVDSRLVRLMVIHADHSCDLTLDDPEDLANNVRIAEVLDDDGDRGIVSQVLLPVTVFWHLRALHGSLYVERCRHYPQLSITERNDNIPVTWLGSLGRLEGYELNDKLLRCQCAATCVMRLTLRRTTTAEDSPGEVHLNGHLCFDCENEQCRQEYHWKIAVKAHGRATRHFIWDITFLARSSDDDSDEFRLVGRGRGYQPSFGRTVVVGPRDRLPQESGLSIVHSFAFWPEEQCRRISQP